MVPWAGHFQCWYVNIFFQIKYTDAILSKSTRKLLSFEISKMLIAVFKNKFIVPFRVYYNFFGTLSFPTRSMFKQGRWVSRVQFTFYLSTAEINIYSRVWFTQSLLAIPGGLIGSVGASVCVGTKTSGWNNLWPKSFAWWFIKCS